jgi:hypothetical protein
MTSKRSPPEQPVVRLDVSRNNSVQVGENIYFVWTDGAERAMVPAKCAHRGGPLHLATACSKTASLVCPWHGSRVTTRALVRQALPMCWREQEATVVLPASSVFSLAWLPVSHDAPEKPLESPCATT